MNSKLIKKLIENEIDTRINWYHIDIINRMLRELDVNATLSTKEVDDDDKVQRLVVTVKGRSAP